MHALKVSDIHRILKYKYEECNFFRPKSYVIDLAITAEQEPIRKSDMSKPLFFVSWLALSLESWTVENDGRLNSLNTLTDAN